MVEIVSMVIALFTPEELELLLVELLPLELLPSRDFLDELRVAERLLDDLVDFVRDPLDDWEVDFLWSGGNSSDILKTNLAGPHAFGGRARELVSEPNLESKDNAQSVISLANLLPEK